MSSVTWIVSLACFTFSPTFQPANTYPALVNVHSGSVYSPDTSSTAAISPFVPSSPGAKLTVYFAGSGVTSVHFAYNVLFAVITVSKLNASPSKFAFSYHPSNV